MKVKIKSFDEIVNDFSTRFNLKPSFIELLKFVFLNSGKTISFDKKEYDSNLTLNLCYIKDGITIPSHIVEKELPAEPETTFQLKETTADSIREMQYSIKPESVNAQVYKILDLIKIQAEIDPTLNIYNVGRLLNHLETYEFSKRGFKISLTGNNIQQSTCISW